MWIARNGNGEVFLHKLEPHRDFDSWCWISDGDALKIKKYLYPDLSWESDPLEVGPKDIDFYWILDRSEVTISGDELRKFEV